MFTSIKKKLILLNLFLSSMVLIFIFSGIYLSMKSQMDRENNDLLESVAISENISPSQLPDARPSIDIPSPRRKDSPKPLALNCFFVRLDSTNEIIDISDNMPKQISNVNELINQMISENSSKGSISYKNSQLEYRIYEKSYGSFLVFLDTHQNKMVLNRLIGVSIVICIISLILVFSISLFWTSKALIPLKEAWERQKSFTTDASHELRTPLAVLQSNIDILIDNPDMTSDEQSPWLDNINCEIKHMTTLTNSLLSISRFDEESLTLNFDHYSINEIVSSVEKSFSLILDKKKISFESKIIDVDKVYCNDIELRRLLVILIDNAIKYSHEYGHISIIVSNKNKYIEFIVKDTGIGISEEHLQQIFDRFYRVDKVRTRNIGGFGLGLTIANLIVKKHNGKISVSSKVNEGTEFKIELPKSI